jgi:agmatinase
MAFYYARSTIADARTVILGIPYDRTSSFVPGSRFGPPHIRIAADNVESYSPCQQRDLESLAIHDAGDLFFEDASWPGVSAKIEAELNRLFAQQKLPISLGGEHSITPPIVAACRKYFPDLAVVHFDAHADLRPSFLNEAHSHATAMYHVAETVGAGRLFQYGIRSGTETEFKTAKNLNPFSVLAPLHRTKPQFQSRPLYVSIDVDVLDPGVMPAVATPEPGGVSYQELRDALLELRDCRIVGIDIVEYNPLANRDLAPASLVASLLREAVLIANPAAGPEI